MERGKRERGKRERGKDGKILGWLKKNKKRK
jgi:hypothetical protein